MSNTEVCAQCASTPGGIEGHSRLAPFDDPERQRLYRCEACFATWRRSYLGSGEFLWIPAGFDETARPGARVTP